MILTAAKPTWFTLTVGQINMQQFSGTPVAMVLLLTPLHWMQAIPLAPMICLTVMWNFASPPPDSMVAAMLKIVLQ